MSSLYMSTCLYLASLDREGVGGEDAESVEALLGRRQRGARREHDTLLARRLHRGGGGAAAGARRRRRGRGEAAGAIAEPGPGPPPPRPDARATALSRFLVGEH